MKTKKIAVNAEVEDFNTQKVIEIYLDANSAKELIVLLSLLREQLSDSLEIILNNFSIYLKLDSDNMSTCSLFDIKKRILKVSISMDELEYFLYYLLKYYRDEMGEVNHIDLDFEYIKNSVATLTVMLDKFKDESDKDIREILGL